MSQTLDPLKDTNTFKDPSFWSKTTWIQLGYGMWANQVVVLIGLAFGFSAVAVPQLTGPNASFSSTLSQRSWIASVIVLTAPVGCLMCGVIMDKIGRRWTLIICLLPMAAGWIATASSHSASQMIYGRILTGVGVGLCAGPSRTYTTEISLPNVRGVSGVLPTFAVSLGIFIQTLLGNLFKWRTIAYICSGYSAFVMLMNFFLPETPYYVLIGGNMERTKQCLRRIRAKSYDIEQELEDMRTFRENNKITKIPFKSTFCKLLQPQAYKPFGIIMIYILTGQLAGMSVMMFWTVDILQSSKLSIDPYIGNLLLGSTRVLSGIGCSIMIFWVARRPLAIGSAFAVGVLCLLMGVFLTINDRPTVVPLLIYLAYVSCAMSGFYTLPLLMLFEMIPLQIRGLLGGITVSMNFIMMFFINAYFPYIKNILGMAATVTLFGIFALLGCLYLFLFLPETKNLTLQEIEEFYRGKRKNLESQRRHIHRHMRTLQLRDAELRDASQDQGTLEKDAKYYRGSKDLLRHLSSVKFHDVKEEVEEDVERKKSSESEKQKSLKKERSVSFNDVKEEKDATDASVSFSGSKK